MMIDALSFSQTSSIIHPIIYLHTHLNGRRMKGWWGKSNLKKYECSKSETECFMTVIKVKGGNKYGWLNFMLRLSPPVKVYCGFLFQVNLLFGIIYFHLFVVSVLARILVKMCHKYGPE